MSPEAIEMPEGMRRLKVGRPSDVWSLGCILYQMVYGHPPFQHLSMVQKMKAIPDDNYAIEFPSKAQRVPPPPKSDSPSEARQKKPKKEEDLSRPVRKEMIRTMRKCLIRLPKDRAAIPELLEEEWLAMKEPPRREFSFHY